MAELAVGVLGLLGTAEICIKTGSKLLGILRAIRGAHDELDARITRLEALCLKTVYQLRILRTLTEGQSLGEEYAEVQDHVLKQVAKCMTLAVQQLDGVTAGAGRVKPLMYALRKKTIDNTIKELEDWQQRYDPTWYLVAVLVKDRSVDKELRDLTRHGLAATDRLSSASTLRRINQAGSQASSAADGVAVSLDPKVFEASTPTSINFTDIRLVTQTSGSKTRLFLVDTLNCEQHLDKTLVRTESESLAKRLKAVDKEASSLLPCQGLVRAKDSEGVLQYIHLLFRFRGTSPKSLRQALVEGHQMTLGIVLDIAKRLAKAINFIHVCGFVHKNVRPETIITTYHETGPDSQAAYLLGFASFRDVNYQTLRIGDTSVEGNLYRHPSRQGLSAQAVYIMQHDIYSLGVCLLELGLRKSFIAYSDDGSTKHLSDAVGLDDTSSSWTAWPRGVEDSVKSHLMAMAEEQLPARMGERFTNVVTACLTCLDPGSEFVKGDDMKDDDGLLIGARFIEKVVLELGKISV